MRPTARLLVLSGTSLLVACVSRPTLQPIEPLRRQSAGDTVRFGPGVTAIEPGGRLLQLELRNPSTVAFYRYNREGHLRFMELRRLGAGVHRISPQRVGQYAIGGQMIRSGYEAILVLVTEEDHGQAPIRNQTEFTPMHPNTVLHELPPYLLRLRSQPWAAYLVEP